MDRARAIVTAVCALVAIAGAVTASAAAFAPRASVGAHGSVARAVVANQVAVDVRGRPIAAFSQSFHGMLRLVISRWTAEGRLDTTFGDGSNGAATVQLLTSVPTEDLGSQMPLLAGTSDGELVLAVSVRHDERSRTAVVRLGDNGAPVRGFGDGGVAVIDVSVVSADPIVLADGRVLLATVRAATADIMRLTADGRPDPTFGAAGTAPLPDRVSAMALDGDDLLVAISGAGVGRLSAAGILSSDVRSISAPGPATVSEIRVVGERIVLSGTYSAPATTCCSAQLPTTCS